MRHSINCLINIDFCISFVAPQVVAFPNQMGNEESASE
jgi:hypothetical protein